MQLPRQERRGGARLAREPLAETVHCEHGSRRFVVAGKPRKPVVAVWDRGLCARQAVVPRSLGDTRSAAAAAGSKDLGYRRASAA